MQGKYSFLEIHKEEWESICNNIKAEKGKQEIPFYLFHEGKVHENIEALRRCTGTSVKIAYAMKANPWLVKAAALTADYIEVCSLGELNLCREYGIPGEKIVLDGTCKDEEFMKTALDMEVKRVSIDSPEQMRSYMNVARRKKKPELFLRVSSGNQFGMNEKEMQECIQMCKMVSDVEVIGLQYYAGTQKNNVRQIREDLEKLQEWLLLCESNQAIQVRKLEFGAGIGVPYFEGEDIAEYRKAMNCVSDFIATMLGRYDVTYEAGRNIAANSGIYVTEVFQLKEREDYRIVFCKGGTNHIHYHGGLLGIRTPIVQEFCSVQSEKKTEMMICGSLCNAGDVLVRRCNMNVEIDVGDLIIFYGVGAYSPTESPNLFKCQRSCCIMKIMIFFKINIWYVVGCIRIS